MFYAFIWSPGTQHRICDKKENISYGYFKNKQQNIRWEKIKQLYNFL